MLIIFCSIELMFSEDKNAMAVYCFGIVHNGAGDQPNFLRYIADKYPRTEVLFFLFFLKIVDGHSPPFTLPLFFYAIVRL